MILTIIAPADLADTSPLFLLGYHIVKVIPQGIRHRSTLGNFSDDSLKRAATRVQLIGRQRVNRMPYRCHILSLWIRSALGTCTVDSSGFRGRITRSDY